MSFCEDRERVKGGQSNKGDVCQPRREASAENKTCQHLNLRLAASRTAEGEFSVGEACGVMSQQPEQTNPRALAEWELRWPGAQCPQPGAQEGSLGGQGLGYEEMATDTSVQMPLQPPGLFLRVPTNRLHFSSWDFPQHSPQSQQNPSAGQTPLFPSQGSFFPHDYCTEPANISHPSFKSQPDHLCSTSSRTICAPP